MSSAFEGVWLRWCLAAVLTLSWCRSVCLGLWICMRVSMISLAALSKSDVCIRLEFGGGIDKQREMITID